MKQIKIFQKENQGITAQGRNAGSFRLKKNIFIPLLIAAMTVTMNLQAQVKIGKDAEPKKGTLLDLNAKDESGYVGGLLLPNVNITKLDEIPMDFSDESVRGKDGDRTQLTGLTIYSLWPCPGVYVWKGAEWKRLGCDCPPAPAINPPAPFCDGKTVSDLLDAVAGDIIAAGNTVKCYDAGGTALAGNTVLVAGPYYVSQTNSSNVESERILVTVSLTYCSPAEGNTITSTATPCVLCGNDASNLIVEAADVTNPVFRLYTSTDAGEQPFATFGTEGYKVPAADLGIDLPNNKQGGYTKWYVSVSGDNYLENAPINRKAITVSGAAIPEFAPYNLGADPTLNTPKKQMNYLANNSFSNVDGHVYGGRFQWGREWNNSSDATSYPISVEGSTYTLYSGGPSALAHSAQLVAASATYNDGTGGNGQIVTYTTGASATGLHVYNGNSPYNWRGTNQNMALWGNGKNPNGASYDMADLDYAAGTGVKYTNDKWYQSPKTPEQYADNDPCKKMNGVNDKSWRLPTQDEWERLTNYDCNPTSAASTTQITSITDAGEAGKAYTWVPVVCNGTQNINKCVPSTDWNDAANSGYAVYKTSVWTNAAADYKDGTLSLDAGGAPEPVLFLPTTGYRDYRGGTLALVGNNGNYWSCSMGTRGFDLGFNKTTVSATNFDYNAHGFSVRCVAEN